MKVKRFMWSIMSGKRLRMLDRNALLSKAGGNAWIINDEEVLSIQSPAYLQDKQRNPHITSSMVIFSKPFVCQIDGATLIGPKGFALSCEGDIILDTVGNTDLLNDVVLITPFNNISRNSSSTEVDTASSLLNYWSSRYYFHWIVESLTRLEGIDLYIERFKHRPKLFIDGNPPKWQTESLDLLGYGNDYIPLKPPSVSVKHLVISSFRREKMVVSPASLRWLRNRAISRLPDEDHKYSRLVYISRIDAGSRQVVNENELLDFLEPMGFKSFVLSKMPFAEQVKLFSQASIVLAPHGAGLTNMVFSSRALIIELFGQNPLPTFYMLSKSAGLNYLSVPCRDDGINIQVDMPILRSVFDTAEVMNYI